MYPDITARTKTIRKTPRLVLITFTPTLVSIVETQQTTSAKIFCQVTYLLTLTVLKYKKFRNLNKKTSLRSLSVAHECPPPLPLFVFGLEISSASFVSPTFSSSLQFRALRMFPINFASLSIDHLSHRQTKHCHSCRKPVTFTPISHFPTCSA